MVHLEGDVMQEVIGAEGCSGLGGDAGGVSISAFFFCLEKPHWVQLVALELPRTIDWKHRNEGEMCYGCEHLSLRSSDLTMSTGHEF